MSMVKACGCLKSHQPFGRKRFLSHWVWTVSCTTDLPLNMSNVWEASDNRPKLTHSYQSTHT